MNINSFVVISAILSFSWIAWNAVVERISRSQRRRRLASRAVLTQHEWIRQHWVTSGDITTAISVCKALSRRLGVHYTQLYGSDTFDFDLALHGPFLWAVDLDLDLDAFEEDVYAITQGRMSAGLSWRSLGALVELVSEMHAAGAIKSSSTR